MQATTGRTLTDAMRRTLGNIIALGGSPTTGNGRDHVGAVRTSTVSALSRAGFVRLGPARDNTDTWYVTAAGCVAFGTEVAVLK